MMKSSFTIGVVGNPNCGKTTLFNALTGAKQRVGNWPGVTVERKTGHYVFQNADFELIDLPGTYSLDVSEEVSIDEKIAREFVAGYEADLIVNIVDASNLERNLYLTTQLLEMKTPVIVALNMMDVAEERGLTINAEALASQLNCKVVPIVASRGLGIEELKTVIAGTASTPHVSDLTIEYPAPIEAAVKQLTPEIEAFKQASSKPALQKASTRWLALTLLEGDANTQSLVGKALEDKLKQAQKSALEAIEEDIDIILADARYGAVNKITGNTITRKRQVTRTISDKIDRVVLNRALGIPVFLLAMYLMFMFTINIGGSFIDFFDIFTGTLLVDGLGELMTTVGAPAWLTLLVANGIGGGIQVVATFIPVIAFLYLFLAALEDSGYMARAAFVMDRAMRAIGLPGKAFVPLIVGFGCNVPAIMATRTMEHQRDRIMTIIMAPFMSCGARLPVYALFAAAFFPTGGQNVVFGLYLIGIAIAILTGLIMKKTILEGQATPFVMELPAYHIPTVKGVLLRTWDRTKTFMFRAGKVIVPMVLVLNVLNAIGTDGSYGNEDTDNSVLSEIGRTIAPAFSPMGLDKENWPAAVGIFTGVLAKEAVVGTLDSLYGEIAAQEAAEAGMAEEEEAFDLLAGLAEAFNTIPANLGDAVGTWSDPLGLNVGDVSSIEVASEEQEVSTGTFGAMMSRFDGAAGAFAYLLFVLLYFPCVAALAAVYRETNLQWTLFVAAWTSGIGYIVATVFYQLAIFSRHPASSAGWIITMLAIFTGTIVAMRYAGSHKPVEQLAVAGRS